MTTLYTASFRSFRSGMGQPVSIALALPRWWDDCRDWPACHLLQPRWSYFSAPDNEFDQAYVAQLDRFGVTKISRVLQRIAREHNADRLVLLCHEGNSAMCHRSLFAAWALDRTGELIQEIP